MKEKISAAAKLLLPALRQYQHNDGSGLLAGYDTEVAERIVAALMVSPAPSAEVEAVEAVARLLTWRGPKYQPVPHGGVCARHYAEYPENHYPDGPWAEDEPLMTVAQHRRIVAARDAEIAQLRADNEALASNLRGKNSITGATYAHLVAERDELRATLSAEVVKNSTQISKENDELHTEIARLNELVAHLKAARDAYGQNAIDADATARGLRSQLAAQQAAVPVALPTPNGRSVYELIAEARANPSDTGRLLYVIDRLHDAFDLIAAPAAPQQGDHSARDLNMVTALSQAVEYLDVSPMESIGSGSVLHQRMRAALVDRSAQGEKP